MASFSHAVGAQTYRFDSLKDVMAKASPARSGDFPGRRGDGGFGVVDGVGFGLAVQDG